MIEKTKSGFEALAKSSLYPQEEMLKVKKAKHTFFIGLPKEISRQENRISLTPDAVAILASVSVSSPTRATAKERFSPSGRRALHSPGRSS